ncbi:MAG: response regulator [Proteobacteria bacterium]|nr:response regulator [Pseudomonadota bacterium]
MDFKKLRVLLVEDVDPMRKLMASVLDALDVGLIYTAPEGKTGFELFCKESPDIVISDWHMDPVDGIELTKKIRNSPISPNRIAPIILVTGFSAFNRVSIARDAGVTEFMIKPFSAKDLAKRLTYVINRPRDFIDAVSYFGPDRRRRADPLYPGPHRRKQDKSTPS